MAYVANYGSNPDQPDPGQVPNEDVYQPSGWYSTNKQRGGLQERNGGMVGDTNLNVQPVYYDPNAFQYGGGEGVAKREAERYHMQGLFAQERDAPDMTKSRYGQDYSKDRYMEMMGRTDQAKGLSEYAKAMRGDQPSVAQNQMQLGFQQSAAANQMARLQGTQASQNALQASQAAAASQAASARGGGANLAAAQRQAAMQQGGLAAAQNQAMTQANAQQNMQMNQLNQQQSAQASMLRAHEMEQARAGYMQGSGQIRAQDQARTNMSGNMAQAQGGLESGQRGRNDQMQMGYEQMGQRVHETQLAAQSKQAELDAKSQQEQQKMQADLEKHNSRGLVDRIWSDVTAKTNIKPASGHYYENLYGSDANRPAEDGNDASSSAPSSGGVLGTVLGLFSDVQHKEHVQDAGVDWGSMAGTLSHGPQKPTPQSAYQYAIHSDKEAKQKAYEAGLSHASAPDRIKAAEQDALKKYGTTDSLSGPAMREYDRLSGEKPRVSDTFAAMRPYSYEYKEPYKYGEGRRVGVMAQDLEKTPGGKPAVVNTPEGKAIDMKAATSLSLAHQADVEHRLRAVEQAKQGGDIGAMASKALHTDEVEAEKRRRQDHDEALAETLVGMYRYGRGGR